MTVHPKDLLGGLCGGKTEGNYSTWEFLLALRILITFLELGLILYIFKFSLTH